MASSDPANPDLHPLIAQHRDALSRLAIKHGVRRLDIVGSALRPDFEPDRSDVDFLVDFGSVPRRGFRDPYFQLKADLESLLGRRVDLVEYDAVTNPYLRESFERTRMMLYAA